MNTIHPTQRRTLADPWACEIKLNGKARYSADNKGWDIQKMELLIELLLLRYGCWLDISRYEGRGISSEREKDQRLWRCEASLGTSSVDSSWRWRHSWSPPRVMLRTLVPM